MSKNASIESRGMYGFDPTGLERAAKAVSILDKSPNAQKAFELAVKEEEIKLLEQKNNLKQKEILKSKIEQENKIIEIKNQLEASKEKAEYEDFLAKKRIEYKLKREKENNDEILKRQEQSIIKQEKEKKDTLTHEHNLKVLQDKLYLQNKYSIKAKLDKENFDIVKEKIKTKSEEERKTKIELRELTLKTIGKGFSKFMKDKNMFNKLLFGLSSAFLLTYASKKIINLTFIQIQNKLFTPKLIKETNKFSLFKNKFSISSLIENIKTINKKNIENKLFFEPSLQNRLNIILNSIKLHELKNLKIPFRNFLFYGPPGTGKTEFAKNLAKQSNLYYIIINGGDIASLGNKSINELNKVFNWIKNSRKKILVFIDESDAFLRSRNDKINLSENLRNTINTFLYRTGNQSNKFFFVLGTNSPYLIDNAVQDRIDEIIHFNLPKFKERKDILIYNAKKNFDEKSFCLFEKNINLITEKTEGFSGRELVKFVVSLFYQYSTSKKGFLDLEILYNALNTFIEQKKIKDKWKDITYKH